MRSARSASNDEIDKCIGQVIRARRMTAGMTQRELGDKLSPSVTFQQIQKYESGKDRTATSRLIQIASALNISLAAFSVEFTHSVSGDDDLSSLIDRPDVLQLLRAFKPVCGNKRAFLIEVVEACANRWFPSCEC